MSNVNVQVSLTNLTQVDRFQSDTHRGPMINQEQNIERAREELSERLQKPVEPDQVEGKKVDPRDRREEEQKRKRKARQEAGRKDKNAEARRRSIEGCGLSVDFEA